VVEKQLQDTKREGERMEQKLKQEIEQKLGREMKQQVTQEMRQEMKQQLSQEIRQQVSQEIRQQVSQEIEQKLSQQLEKRMEEKLQKEKTGLLESNKKELDQINLRMDALKNQLNHAAESKVHLIQCANNEINRLNRVVNTLLQNETCKEITRLLLDDSIKQQYL